jgi:hypothetical protein
MEQPCLLSEEEQNPEPEKRLKETKEIDDEDAELIFVGVECVSEDAELVFVGVTSNSKPVVSNILNRVTPGSCSRRKKYGHLRKKNAHRVQPTSPMASTSETVIVLPASPSESRSTVLLLSLYLYLIIKIIHHKSCLLDLQCYLLLWLHSQVHCIIQ